MHIHIGMGTDKLTTEIRQEQIVRAALGLIAAEGVGTLSVGRIARKVGLVPSAIYRHFRGKDEVIDAVMGLIRELLLANVTGVRKQAENPLDALRLLMNRHLKLLCENDGISTLIFSDQVYSGPAKRKSRVYAVIDEYRSGISQLVQEGQRKRLIRDGLDPDAIAVMFLGLVQPPSILWHLSEGRFDVRKQATQGWQMFETAIGRR